MKLSVIVASRNRSASLRVLLENLENQDSAADLTYEVIVVDNGSQDETRETGKSFVSHSPDKFRYVFAKIPGKSRALNSGIRVAKGDVLVFTDDDCIPEVGWLRAIACEFTSDPSLCVLGGRVELYCVEDRPVTIRTGRERIPFSSVGQLFSLVVGCNMAVRRRALDVVGGFDPALGPGTRMAAAEDVELIYRIFKAGFKIVYSPDVVVYHNHGRKTDEQVKVLKRDYVVGRGAFYCKHILRGDLQILKMAYWEISSLLSELFRARFSGQAAGDQPSLLWNLLVGTGYIPSALRHQVARHFEARL